MLDTTWLRIPKKPTSNEKGTGRKLSAVHPLHGPIQMREGAEIASQNKNEERTIPLEEQNSGLSMFYGFALFR